MDLKEKIELIDKLLSQITLNGNELMYLAIARQRLKEVYDAVAASKKQENTD